MIKAISPFFLGTKASVYETAPTIAAQGYFQGYYSMNIKADTARGGAETRRTFAENGLTPVGFCMEPKLDEVDEVFERDIVAMEWTIAAAAEAGFPCAMAWIMPGSDHHEPDEYHRIVIHRMRRMCDLLAKHGLSLCMEMVAPKPLQQSFRYPIACTTADLLPLLRAVERPNLGVVLDMFHAHCTGQAEAEYAQLTGDVPVLMAHACDGVAGRAPWEQLDQDRRLPGETGVIPCQPFFACLRRLQYEAAVVLEPIDERFAAQGFPEVLRQAAEALSRVWPENA